MSTPHSIRPEERRRSGSDESPIWADTLPTCFRSEGFAEDLPDGLRLVAHPVRPARPSSFWRSTLQLPAGMSLARVFGS